MILDKTERYVRSRQSSIVLETNPEVALKREGMKTSEIKEMRATKLLC